MITKRLKRSQRLSATFPGRDRNNMYERERELHRELWEWIIKNPFSNKDEWVRWRSNGGNIENVYNDCFACDIARKLIGSDRSVSMCAFCPIKWKGNRGCNNPFSVWCEYIWAKEDGCYRYATKMARKIKDQKWINSKE